MPTPINEDPLSVHVNSPNCCSCPDLSYIAIGPPQFAYTVLCATIQSIFIYVRSLSFFSWKEHAMNKVIKAEVDTNVILRKGMEKKLSLTPPPKI